MRHVTRRLREPRNGDPLLARLIAAKKMTQDEFADVCGIARETISKYASGTRRYTRPNAERMAPTLGVITDELMRDQAERLAKKRNLLRALQDALADLSERVARLEEQQPQGSQRAG